MKKLTTLFTAICMAVTIQSCTKSELPINSEIPNSSDKVSINSAGDRLYDLLGYGYDVTGRFANQQSARNKIIDIEKFIQAEPNNYLPSIGVNQYFITTSGSDAFDYTYKMSQKYKATSNLQDLTGINKISVFSGEANVNYNSENTFDQKYVYSSTKLIIEQKRLRIFSSIENIKANYLSDGFKSDLINLSPAELVYRYGTHVLIDITLGARFDANYSAETTNSKRVAAGEVGAKINIGLIFSFNTTTTYDNNEGTHNYNQNLNWSTTGGDGSQGLIGELSLDGITPPKLSINAWQSTCKPENATLIGIGEDGLVAITDLISDPAKQMAVKNYIIQYFLDREVKLVGVNYEGRYDGQFIEDTSTGRMYIGMENRLRHIQSLETLQGLFKFTFDSRNPTPWTKYSNLRNLPIVGETILPDNNLITDVSAGKIYLREGNVIRHITSTAVFNKYQFNPTANRNVNSIAGYTVGLPLY